MRPGARGPFLLLNLIFLTLSGGLSLEAQAGSPVLPGDPALGEMAAAEKYLEYARKAADEGRWDDAFVVLERAQDYGDISSDLSWLLAKVRLRLGKSRGAVLEAINRAIAVGWWKHYSPLEAWQGAVEILINLKFYHEALNILAVLPESADTVCLRLLALHGYGSAGAFRSFMAYALDRYPRDPRPVRILLDVAGQKIRDSYYIGSPPGGPAGALNGGARLPDPEEMELVTLALRRLPILVDHDPELAWMAAPFFRDIDDAKRQVLAYRAGGGASRRPSRASLPISLHLGVIGEDLAISELFAPPSGDAAADRDLSAGGLPAAGLDRDLLEELWGLFRNEGARERFARNLEAYSGVISFDGNKDGIPEEYAVYEEGILADYRFDRDQDGLADLTVLFEAGEPREALVRALPEAALPVRLAGYPGGGWTGGAFVLPRRDEDRGCTRLRWEQYPSVLEAEQGGVKYRPRPLAFFFAPLRFRELCGSGLLYPQEEFEGGPSRRGLVSVSLLIERPSGEFAGGIERVELERGIPLRAREYLGEALVSETTFFRGKPQFQTIDLDMDGRRETIRRFRQASRRGAEGAPEGAEQDAFDFLDHIGEFEYAESDWDGDGIFETRQYY